MKLNVYVGREKPLTAVGKNQSHLLNFAVKYPGWHYYNTKCRATVAAIGGLKRRGSIELRGDFPDHQFRIKMEQSNDKSIQAHG